jgi:hypothetical protein
MEPREAQELFHWTDPVEALRRIFQSPYGPRVKTALIYALEGAGYRDAAHRAGLSDHKDVYRAARKLGLEEIHRDRQLERSSMRYSKRDRAAVEAVLRGGATMRQLIRAMNASSKRGASLERR